MLQNKTFDFYMTGSQKCTYYNKGFNWCGILGWIYAAEFPQWLGGGGSLVSHIFIHPDPRTATIKVYKRAANNRNFTWGLRYSIYYK